MNSLGVYFSANDMVYDWAIAFLNSFRTFNPDLQLILIPFNEECDLILELQDVYHFEIYSDQSFKRLEAIGKAFELGLTPTGPYWFRRYASFWGPCDRFMYLDARQIVLADLKPIIQALDTYNFGLLHFDCAINQVYEPKELRRKLLRRGKATGFNSGRWASRKGLFTLEELEHFASKALKIREQLNPRNTDQAFINYCCDTKLICSGHVADVLGFTCQSSWANQPGNLYKRNSKYFLWDYGGLDHKKQFLLLHWAGYKTNQFKPKVYLYLKYRYQKLFFLHKYYSIVTRYFHNAVLFLFYCIKSNQIFNDYYHGLKK